MRLRVALGFGLGTAVLVACVPGSPIYLGPPIVTLEGHVFAFETLAPIPDAEICVFSADTTCIASDQDGHYRVHLPEPQLLEGGRCMLRFRAPGRRTHISELADLQAGTTLTVDCGISNRVAMAGGPATCLTPSSSPLP
ncbi:MAG: carboxypeptidase-like regulatory domain-containing protein [Gemmatimonadales bacterium]|jgi:hypothetical protein